MTSVLIGDSDEFSGVVENSQDTNVSIHRTIVDGTDTNPLLVLEHPPIDGKLGSPQPVLNRARFEFGRSIEDDGFFVFDICAANGS